MTTAGGQFAMTLNGQKVLAALIGLSLVVGCYQAVMFSFGYAVGPSFQATWSLVFLLLLVAWMELDGRNRKDIYRPFEFGFLVFMFWLPYLPYYLLRTRRASGLFWLFGFLLLFNAGYLFQWLVNLAR